MEASPGVLLSAQVVNPPAGRSAKGDPSPALRRTFSRRDRIQRFLDTARASLGMDVAFLTSLDGTTQTLTHLSAVDCSCGLEVGSSVPRRDGFCHYVLSGELANAVPDTARNEITARVLANSGVGIGAYVGVPVTLGTGRVYGALCVSSCGPVGDLGSADVAFMNFLARLIAEDLTDQERAMVAETLQHRELDTWLAPGGLTIHAQPIVDLTSGAVRGVEALARFPGHPGSPADIFAAAEQLGRGAELETAAVRSAVALLPRLPEHVHLAVNVSPNVMDDPDLREVLFAAPGDRLVLELTEHVAFSDCPRLPELLRGLRAHGIRIAIDDAGSGYAGLQIILALAPDLIKLDIALIKNIHQDPVRRALVRALTGFAAETDTTIVAEGIENQKELEALRDLGVTLGQGYHIGRPAPFRNLNRLVKTRSVRPAKRCQKNVFS